MPPIAGSPNPRGLLGQPWILIAPDDPETIYLLCSVNPPSADPLDVHFVRSVDGGVTWSEPVHVNDEAGSDAWQWFGTMSVAPNGRIDVIWNDTRNDASNPTPTTSELFYAFSKNGGVSWSSNLAVSPPFKHFDGYPNQDKLGDYYHMISEDLVAHVAYAATFNQQAGGGFGQLVVHEQDVYYLAIDQTMLCFEMCGMSGKVRFCHEPAGSPGEEHTICISQSSVAAHLFNHPGDHCGPCFGAQYEGDLGDMPSMQVDVLSNVPGVFVEIGPADTFNDGGGVVPYVRYYQPASVITLDAPKVFNGRTFLGWNVEGLGFGGWYTGTQLQLPITDGYTIEAVYETLGPARW